MVPTGNGEVALPSDDGQQSSDDSDLLLDGNVVLEDNPGQPVLLNLRRADALQPVSGSVQRQFSAVLLNSVIGMLAAQAVALHAGGMECLRRAMIPDQPAEFASKLRKDGANLLRSMTEMLEVLDRKRGKGPQVVRVERVVVHEGGQAVVGNVQAGGG